MEARKTAPPSRRGAGYGTGLRPSGFSVALCLAGVLAGAGAWTLSPTAARGLWALVTVGALIPLTIAVAVKLSRREMGVDIIALLAMAGSLATASALPGKSIVSISRRSSAGIFLAMSFSVIYRCRLRMKNQDACPSFCLCL